MKRWYTLTYLSYASLCRYDDANMRPIPLTNTTKGQALTPATKGNTGVGGLPGVEHPPAYDDVRFGYTNVGESDQHPTMKSNKVWPSDANDNN